MHDVVFVSIDHDTKGVEGLDSIRRPRSNREDALPYTNDYQ